MAVLVLIKDAVLLLRGRCFVFCLTEIGCKIDRVLFGVSVRVYFEYNCTSAGVFVTFFGVLCKFDKAA